MITAFALLLLSQSSPDAVYNRIANSAARPETAAEAQASANEHAQRLNSLLDAKEIERKHKRLQQRVNSMTRANKEKLASVITAKLPEIKRRYEVAGAQPKTITYIEDEFVEQWLMQMFGK